MPTDITLLRVLVASPSDVAADRELVRRVVESLNPALSRDQVQLEVIAWDTHAVPGFSTDPQAVINDQLRSWDIFIGLMGARFGTSTPRAGSGTEKEFNSAYDRWDRDNQSCRIMFYFSNPNVSLLELDKGTLTQLMKVRSFQDRLGEIGGLYWTYRDPIELQGDLSRHLHHTVQEYLDGLWGHSGLAISDVALGSAPDDRAIDDGPPSMIDLAADFEESFESLTTSIERIGSALRGMGERVQSRIPQVASGEHRARPSARATQAVVAAAASDIQTMATTVNQEVPRFRQEWSIAKDALFQMLTITSIRDAGDLSALESMRTNLTHLQENAIASLDMLESLLSTISGLGMISRTMRKAVREAGGSISALRSEIETLVSESKDIDRAIEKRIEKGFDAQ